MNDGVTVRQYSEHTGLPVSFLESLGLRNCTHQRRSAVVMPYRDEAGKVTHERLRLSLEKGKGIQRFHTRAGDSPGLYGLWRLHEARKLGYVFLVEGESDCHVLWFKRLPALGVPGADNWKTERDAPHLADIEKVYALIEPDGGGEAFFRRLTS